MKDKMKKSLIALMATMAVAIFSWPSICFGDERTHKDRIEPIDAQEYAAAQPEMMRYNMFPKELTGDSAIKDEFISKVVEFDEDAKYIFSELEDSNEFFYDLFEISSGDTTIYMLRFITPVLNFCYLATKATNGTLSVSDVKIDSDPIVVSKDGYIAGFKDVQDGFWVEPTIYSFSLDKTTGKLSITKLGAFINADDDPWKIHQCFCIGLAFKFADPHPAFWRERTLYMEGWRMPEIIDGFWGPDSVSYYKLVIDDCF